MHSEILEQLIIKNNSKIIFLVMDGVGGLEMEGKGGTELQVAHTPNFDALATRSSCGMFDPVFPGITPGSGPGHFGLFGYDPLTSNIGRGVLAAAGIGFQLTKKDVAARINFATSDENGNVIDRRAGRIGNEENTRICKKLRQGIDLKDKGVEVFIETVKEHRAVVIFRGENLSGDLEDTDPQKTGVPPKSPVATSSDGDRMLPIVTAFIKQAQNILADEPKVNTVLLRGFAKFQPYKTMEERYGLKCLAIANYPMYRGIANILGMDLNPITEDIKTQFEAVQEKFKDYDFFFVHVKYTDSRGEDGDFDAKVKVIEEVDKLLPILTDLHPDVMVVTADHSTPAVLKAHSWHPVPVLVQAKYARVDEVQTFNEIACITGTLGRQPMINLMPIVLANAIRLQKYGA
jgi:2,3-bisphosphoglycerate-independent phosphoglycerate mutase